MLGQRSKLIHVVHSRTISRIVRSSVHVFKPITQETHKYKPQHCGISKYRPHNIQLEDERTSARFGLIHSGKQHAKGKGCELVCVCVCVCVHTRTHAMCN